MNAAVHRMATGRRRRPHDPCVDGRDASGCGSAERAVELAPGRARRRGPLDPLAVRDRARRPVLVDGHARRRPGRRGRRPIHAADGGGDPRGADRRTAERSARADVLERTGGDRRSRASSTGGRSFELRRRHARPRAGLCSGSRRPTPFRLERRLAAASRRARSPGSAPVTARASTSAGGASARRRPPLHRARLPAGPARGGRRPPGRLRAGALAALERSGRRSGSRPTAPGLELDLGDAGRGLAAARRGAAARSTCSATRPRRRACASYLRLTGMPRAAPGVGIRALEEPGRLRAPARRRGRLRRLPRARAAARRDRDRLALGDAVQHLALQPAPVPGRPRAMIERMRADGVRTVVWVTPWVNLESADGQYPPRSRVRSACTAGRPRTTPRRRSAGHFVRGADGDPFVGALVDGHRLADRLHLARRPGAGGRRRRAACCEMGVEGIKADDGEGYYFPPDVSLRRRAHRRRGWRGTTGGLYRRDDAGGARRGAPRRGRPLRALRLDRPAGDRDAVGRRPGLGLLVAADAGRGDADRGRERLLELVARRRRLPRQAAGRALPARAAGALGPVRLLHAR